MIYSAQTCPQMNERTEKEKKKERGGRICSGSGRNRGSKKNGRKRRKKGKESRTYSIVEKEKEISLYFYSPVNFRALKL